MKNFIFKMFTKKIEVKISKIDDGNKRIEFLARGLMKEMELQGFYRFDGTCGNIIIFEHEKRFKIYGSENAELNFSKGKEGRSD